MGYLNLYMFTLIYRDFVVLIRFDPVHSAAGGESRMCRLSYEVFFHADYSSTTSGFKVSRYTINNFKHGTLWFLE